MNRHYIVGCMSRRDRTGKTAGYVRAREPIAAKCLEIKF